MPTLLAALEIMTAQDPHRPVMVERTLEFLIPRGGIFLDATVGYGGHAEALLDAGDPDLTLVGMDRDAEALDFTRTRLSRFGDRVTLVKESFSNLSTALDDLGIDRIDGALFDLGMSSPQVDEAERGFGWTHPGPLDMRMDRTTGLTAADLVNNLDVGNLASLLRRYSDERYARRIARAIVRERQKNRLRSTDQLADIVSASIPRAPEHIHPATRTFQALRIAVNDELNGLYDFIVGAARLLAPGGRLVILSFHSLEDRLAKQAFRYLESDCVCPPRLPQCVCTKFTEVELLTKRPLTPKNKEIEANPRSRSANLRALVRL